MADRRRAHPANVPGDFFVDTTCIDCPTCRQIAPATFGAADDQAVVLRQPADAAERQRALMGLVSCPVGSIGGPPRVDVRPAIAALPEPIADDVYACGFASPASFGAHSYFIRRAEGNVLVDSPRFTEPLARRLASFGGIRFMFLTHRDDVADHAKFHRRFGCERIIHEAELSDGLRALERPLTGDGPWTLAPDLRVIATPGHTRGHTVLLYRETFLFTGDHLWWDGERLAASREYNWWSWDEQLASIEKLRGEPFAWVLPGHGYRHQAAPARMQAALADGLARLRGR